MNNDSIHAGFSNKFKITVLLIDDQKIIGEAVRRMLSTETDIVFYFCQDPAKAVDTANTVKPTVILQDLVMPELDGLTLVKYFRANPATKEVPLIVLSSEENVKVKAEAFELEANDYIIKLPDKIELIARIRHHSQGYINMLERNEAFEAMLKSQKALAAELAEAADYVLSLLPDPIKGPLFYVDWKFIPSRSLGGDAFGYHWLDEDNFAMYLLDVAGHGVGAALLSVSATEVLRTQTLMDTDFLNPARVLAQLNNSFKMQEHNQKFFTIWYGVFNKKHRTIKYSSAGHPPAVLLSGDSPDAMIRSELKTHGTMIGALDDAEYENQEVSLKKFNRLFLYSDGIFEIIKPDGQLWDFKEFLNVLSSNHNSIEEIYNAISEVRAGSVFDDDFSILRVSF